MRPTFTNHLIATRAAQYGQSQKTTAVASSIVGLLALSPLCAVTGLMLAQILGFVPY